MGDPLGGTVRTLAIGCLSLFAPRCFSSVGGLHGS
jgi:hypothetical protein